MLFDGFRVTNMGNVLRMVLKVWHGKEFTKAREHHEKGEWDKVPFCKNCNGWANMTMRKVIDGHLVRSSPQYIYYKKLIKLKIGQKILEVDINFLMKKPKIYFFLCMGRKIY